MIVAQNGAGQIYDDTTPQSPAVILRTDDYGRIYRIIADGTPVPSNSTCQNQYFPRGEDVSYVTVAEIPGTDKADEVVMLGGHLDSWTSATGATDNAIGCAIMMEAARMLEAVGAKPRRTIRVALWSGEEEGLLGSFAYVKAHFGSRRGADERLRRSSTPTGTSTTAPAACAARRCSVRPRPPRSWPSTSSRSRSGACSARRPRAPASKAAATTARSPSPGCRASAPQQDPIEYNSTTWHTNLDTYERIVPEDVMHNAVVSAALVLGLANRDQMLPRFAAGSMPPVPPARGFGGRGAVNAGPTAVAHVYLASKGVPLAVRSPGLIVATPAAANPR